VRAGRQGLAGPVRQEELAVRALRLNPALAARLPGWRLNSIQPAV